MFFFSILTLYNTSERPIKDRSLLTPAFTRWREASIKSADRNKTNVSIKERNGHTEGLRIDSLISHKLAHITHTDIASAPSDNCFLKPARWKSFKNTLWRRKVTQRMRRVSFSQDPILYYNRCKTVKVILCLRKPKSQNECGATIIITTTNYHLSSCVSQVTKALMLHLRTEHSNLQLPH